MAIQRKNKSFNQHKKYLELAFNLAYINIGSTKTNPSVGCVVEKNGSIISSGYTSINGRPHAEFNALNKEIDFKNSNLYVTLEPCTHFGKTPPCTNLIKKKGIRNVFYSIDDYDTRSKRKSKKVLSKKKIKVRTNLLKQKGINFYKSYYNFKNGKKPLIDGKIAVSNDYFTINKIKKRITNDNSQRLSHLLRSRYNAIISTAKSINKDNSLLNCRIDGLREKTPDLIIIDRNLILKKNLNLYKKKNNRKIKIFTMKNKIKKIKWLKKRGVKVILKQSMGNKNDYIEIFKSLNIQGYSRIFVEAGLIFINFLIKNKLLDNIYIFKTDFNLKKNGLNNTSNNVIKKIKLKNRLKVNLFNDKVYKVKLK